MVIGTLTSRKHLWLLSVAFILHGCASTNDYWPSSHVDRCDEHGYAREGHYNTTELVAKMAGLDSTDAARLAYFSQAPDEMAFKYSAPAVGVWGVIPPFWLYRPKIMNTLHSLHNGDNLQVTGRRQQLKDLIISYRSLHDSPDNDWKVGFLIHAMGDSYAHVYGEEGNLHAYGGFFGHVFDNGDGENRPDVIVMNDNSSSYIEYVRSLYDALNANNESRGDRDALKKYILAVEAQVKVGTNNDFVKFVQSYPYTRQTSPQSEASIGQWWLSTSNCLAAGKDKAAEWGNEIHFFKVSAFLSEIRSKL